MCLYNRVMTQSQDDLASQLASVLRSRFNVLAGDRIGVLGDVEHMLPVYHALWMLGACAVPLDVGTLKNTETLNAANAIYVIASEDRLARAVQAVESTVHDLAGARRLDARHLGARHLGACLRREVIQFGGVAGAVFPHLDSLVQGATGAVVNTDMAMNEALLLYLYFMGKVQVYSYTQADLQAVPAQLLTPKPRPKFAVIRFYPVVETLLAHFV